MTLRIRALEGWSLFRRTALHKSSYCGKTRMAQVPPKKIAICGLHPSGCSCFSDARSTSVSFARRRRGAMLWGRMVQPTRCIRRPIINLFRWRRCFSLSPVSEAHYLLRPSCLNLGLISTLQRCASSLDLPFSWAVFSTLASGTTTVLYICAIYNHFLANLKRDKNFSNKYKCYMKRW